jgi:AraC-like DNA-binding protein
MLPDNDPFLENLRQQIAISLMETAPDVRIVTLARRIGMSTRSLQRRLGDRNTSWSAIVDDVRRNMAMTLLSRDDVSLAQMAEQLGFACVPTVFRAFRRWTGTSPRAYQRTLRQSQVPRSA